MITLRCPCGKQLKVKDERAGTKVKCPECEEILRVPEAGGIREKPVPPKTRPVADKEGIEDRPRRRAARSDDDDADDRAHRRQKAGGNGLMIGIIVGSVLLLAGGGVALFFLLKSDGSGVGPGGRVGAAQDKIILSNNLKQLALAMHSFNDAYKRIPAPGFSKDPVSPRTNPLLSWRVAVLPFVEEGQLYNEFKLDEPWDGPNNIKLLNRMPRIYQPVGPQPKKDGHTYLQFVTGPGTVFPPPPGPKPGWFVAKIPISFPDGLSNTIIVVEAAEPVPWTKPADFTIDVTNVDQGLVPKLGAFSPDGFYAALGDGSMCFLDRRRVSHRTIRIAFNPADGNAMPQDW